jgi:hypothetical protein
MGFFSLDKTEVCGWLSAMTGKTASVAAAEQLSAIAPLTV